MNDEEVKEFVLLNEKLTVKTKSCVDCASSDVLKKNIMAFVQGKPVYSEFCKSCLKAHWMEFKKNHPELWKALQYDKDENKKSLCE